MQINAVLSGRLSQVVCVLEAGSVWDGPIDDLSVLHRDPQPSARQRRGADLDVGGGDPRAGAPWDAYAAPTLTERVAYIVCTAEIFLSSFWDGSNRQRCRCAAGATVYLEQLVRTMRPLCGTIGPKQSRLSTQHDGMDRLGREDPMQVSPSRHVSSLGLACSAWTCSPSCTGVSRSLRGT
ncbi:hypothetical protein LZ31DRAFT_88281 [Colletotrichum somersetense]|nr:hypothetical protein LZ31DRAFT_88281 [Colletotrichum somersetense]